MKRYHKTFKINPDMSTYLDNCETLISDVEELLHRLTISRNMDELRNAKYSILKDFFDIYDFDVSDADFPEPVGYFDNERKKKEFIKKKILLQDMVRYLGNVYKKYHTLIYEKSNTLPEIQLKSSAIDYTEIYRKAMEDYITAIANDQIHAITASFVLPSLIERGLSINLQNRLLYKSICQLPDSEYLSKPLDAEERAYVDAFLRNSHDFLFNASESHVMGKMYNLLVREGALKASAENKMILTGVGRVNKKNVTRTLGSLLKTNFAKEELLPAYRKLMIDLFDRLNIRNCIMHGLGETFDYLNLGFVAIMFQLLWDIADCTIFKD